jgi:hypothetical protein
MPNYPTSPVTNEQTGPWVFPSNLNTSTNGYNISLYVGEYNRPSVFSPPVINWGAGTQIVLPIPIKINDVQTVTWEQASLTSLALSAGGDIASGIANAFGGKKGTGLLNSAEAIGELAITALGYSNGVAINPNLIMLFKNQNFKKHTLQWLFAPNNPQDSNNLQSIIKFLKNAMLPGTSGNISSLGDAGRIFGSAISSAINQAIGSSTMSLGLSYPSIVQPVLSVNSYTYNFKPCAIESLSVDFSAGSTPSFFGQNKAPALVSLNMQLTEIELWFNGQI